MTNSEKIIYYITHPVFLVRRSFLKLYEIRHSKEPWISQKAVRFCDHHLKSDMLALEWGSGRSTPWFAKRVQRLTSIEHQKEWFDIVREKLKSEGVTNIDYRFIALDHALGEATHNKAFEVQPAYVQVASQFPDQSLSFVVVDGHYRQACIQAILGKIKSKGYLLVDNTNWLPMHEWNVPSDWKIAHQSENVMTQTTIWQKP